MVESNYDFATRVLHEPGGQSDYIRGVGVAILALIDEQRGRQIKEVKWLPLDLTSAEPTPKVE